MALRRAIGAVKDRTSISLARVSGTDSLSELEIAVVKATRHEEYPAEERHVQEILSLTHYSRQLVSTCVSTIARRLNRTRNWVVALKCLILIQRLLSEAEAVYEKEVFFATRRGTRLLNLSDFRDATGRSHSWDFSAFVRTYSLYLDERLDYRMQGMKKSNVGVAYAYAYEKHYCEEDGVGGEVEAQGKEVGMEHLIITVQQLQQLQERFLATRPTGAAKRHRVVLVALYPVVRESFLTYYEITDILSLLIEAFMEVEIHEAVKIQDIFWRSSKQFEELDSYFNWTKEVGVVRLSEYPHIERISPKKLELMDDFLRRRRANPQLNSAPLMLNMPQEEVEEAEDEEDPNTIKALPAPDDEPEEEKKEEDIEEKQEEEPKQQLLIQHEGDLLNLWDEPVTSEQHGNELSLVLFDGLGATEAGPNPNPLSGSVWDAYKGSDSDWEAELVQSASYLPQQQTQMGGGLDKLVLDGLYRQGSATMTGGTGSASSVAFRSAGNPPAQMLALLAPPGLQSSTTEGDVSSSGAMRAVQIDPFGSSMGVPPPPYVQMSELEQKQRMMMEEQMMWQQYARGGMQGQMGAQYTQGYNPQMQGYNPNGYRYY